MQVCCLNCIYINHNIQVGGCVVLQGDCDPGNEFCDFTSDE